MSASTNKSQVYHIFGIRHHGPGSTRMLMAELERLQPDCLLIEGPPDADAILSLAHDVDMEPPVALLIYAKDTPKQATFYPFTIFSPEWQALRFGLHAGIPVRFMDLPQRHQLATEVNDNTANNPAEDTASNNLTADDEELISQDPLYWMAKAVGLTDGEEWWERFVEERRDSTDIFSAIGETMTALRQELPRKLNNITELREQRREAYMRETMRQAAKDGFKRIAIVCGAWHVPALATLPPATQDRTILKNLPKISVEAAWVPWTYGRISSSSGYGAGVAAPGYYEHLWQYGTKPRQSAIVGWMTKVANLLRQENIDCSSAHLIEAVRLADALAAFRERPTPGLDELSEAIQTVIAMGDDAPIRLIEQRLLIGDRLGKVPDSAPTVPLARDLAKQQTKLRLKPEASQRDLDLDLRKPTDLDRSHLLQRLLLLGVTWGIIQEKYTNVKGTFHEYWRLQWTPELAIRLIEASVWGSTVEAAATAFALQQATSLTELANIAALANAVLQANLPLAITGVVTRLETVAATTGSVTHLLDAIPPLAKIFRYGSVRAIDTSQLQHVLDGMVERVCIGLPLACSALDDDAASAMHIRLLGVHESIKMLEHADHTNTWHQTLITVADRDGSHGLIAGAAVRQLLDDQIEPNERTQTRLSLALSTGVEPTQAAAWLQGFLHGSGIVLLHDDRLWTALDKWLTDLEPATFIRILPLIRRTFSKFPNAERRQIGERAKHQTLQPVAQKTAATTTTAVNWQQSRVDSMAPVLKLILGL